MRIKDAQTIRLIEKLGEHYRNNLANRFLRPLLLQLNIDKQTWDQIEFLTEKIELSNYQGLHLDELYRQIAACAKFVQAARNNLIPSLKSKINAIPNTSDRLLRDMAASNFNSNLQVFADILNEIYVELAAMDRKSSGENPPVYTQVFELQSLGRCLVGS